VSLCEWCVCISFECIYVPLVSVYRSLHVSLVSVHRSQQLVNTAVVLECVCVACECIFVSLCVSFDCI